MERAPNLRMIALASTVALAVAMPLAAATAGPAESERSAPDGSAITPQADGRTPVRADPSDPSGAPDAGTDTGTGTGMGTGAAHTSDSRRKSRCGPELASPEGVEAQTCVLAEGGRSWARTYYRNTSGEPLRAVLTLMRPDGRTVQAYCEISAGDEPGTCETPREPTVGGGSAAYTAVAELADARGERKLLRTGSNVAPGERGSDQ
ncbi:hypothetical protein [Streptomyces rimosus]|uniref:hypothetical protein n=1 Tax=Streptomyces rimosus TaxID=1927 RepID=UPI0004C5B483|nr:hypothetical protein [Streptomyces rimosus]